METLSIAGLKLGVEIAIPEEVRLRYIERRKKDLETLRMALGQSHYEEFLRIGHQLKGNAASFGYLDLEQIAIQMEAAAKNNDHMNLTRQVDLFAQWLHSTATSVKL